MRLSAAVRHLRVGGPDGATSRAMEARAEAKDAGARSGPERRKRALQRSLEPLMAALFCEENPVPRRHALALIGLETGSSPVPLHPLSDSARKRVEKAMSDLRASGFDLPRAA